MKCAWLFGFELLYFGSLRVVVVVVAVVICYLYEQRELFQKKFETNE